MARHYAEMPKYLLAPEIAGVLHYLPDWSKHAFINTLWNTGARLNEALALRRRDFHLNDEIPHVVIRTAKQRRTAGGRLRKGKSTNLVVPLSDPGYVDEMHRLFASTRERFEEYRESGEHRVMPVWELPIARFETGFNGPLTQQPATESGSASPSVRIHSGTVLPCTFFMAMCTRRFCRV